MIFRVYKGQTVSFQVFKQDSSHYTRLMTASNTKSLKPLLDTREYESCGYSSSIVTIDQMVAPSPIEYDYSWLLPLEPSRKMRKTPWIIMPTDYSLLSWTSCYDNHCQIYFSDKDSSGWFLCTPKQKPKTLSSSSLSSTTDLRNDAPLKDPPPRDPPAS